MTRTRSTTRRTRRMLLTASFAAAAMLVAACSDATPASTTTAAPVTTEAPAPTTEAPAPAKVAIRTVDYAFEGLPASVATGTAITLENASEAELHEFVAIRLPDDETRSVEELLQLPPEELAAFFPMVETVVIAPPGEGGIAVEGTGVLTEPGRYAIICAIPTGADPAEYMAAAAETEGGPPEVDGGPPHFVVGMYAELTVEG